MEAGVCRPTSRAKQRRMYEMLENSATYSDVEFQVGEDPDATSFMGLKAMYARSSEVFSKMFFEGGFREQQVAYPRQVVRILDILPAAFEQLHRWVYDVEIDLPVEIVFHVLVAARKYMVEDLELHCRREIASTARTPGGVLGLYASAYTSCQEEWAEALTQRLESFGPPVLASPEVARLPYEAFVALISNADVGVIPESAVLQAARTWATLAGKRDEDPTEAWELIVRNQLVRFDLLEPRMFAEEVVIPGLISQDHALRVFVDGATAAGRRREVSVAGRIRSVLCEVRADDGLACVELLIALSDEAGFPEALAKCLVEKALADHDRCEDWVCMWSELWGALRAKQHRDGCVRAVVDYCQLLFEENPKPDALVHVWTCPEDTLGLVRVLCRLNYMRRLAVSPLIRVLEVLVSTAEADVQACAPVSAAQELVSYLLEASTRWRHLAALKGLPELRERLAKVAEHV